MMEINNIKYNFDNEVKEWDDEQNRQNEKGRAMNNEINKIDSLSEEEKEKMKNRIFYSALDEFDDIANEIIEKNKTTKNIK